MPGAAFPLKFSDIAPWLQNVSAQASKVDWQPAFKQIALLLEASAKECFEGGRSPEGQPWAPLKHPRDRPRDRNARTGDGNAQRPLRDTGALMASLSAGGEHHVERMTDSVFNWGTNLDYAGVHQFGHTFNRPEKRRGPGEKPWVFTGKDGNTVFTRHIKAHQQTVPARPFLGLTPTLLEDMEQVIREEFERQVLGMG
jgi:phage gpG-like protein